MANSIQLLVGSISYVPAVPQIGEDVVAAQAFVDAVDAGLTYPAAVAQIAPEAFVALPSLVAADAVPQMGALTVAPVADLVVFPEPIPALGADLVQKDGLAQVANPPTDKNETAEIPDLSPTSVPVQFFAVMPPPLDKPLIKAAVEASISASQVLIKRANAPLPRMQPDVLPMAMATELVPKSEEQPVSSPAPIADDPARPPDNVLPAGQVKVPLDRLTKDAPLATVQPPATESVFQEPTLAPQRQAAPAVLHDPRPPSIAAPAPGRDNRSLLAPLFASVPHLAPKIILMPNAPKATAPEVPEPAVVDAELAPAPKTAASFTPAPALPATLPTETARALQTSETDELRLPTSDGGLLLPSDGKPAVQSPLGTVMTDKALPQANVPVPVAALPQTIARIAASDGQQPVSLQLDPIELGTVAFNMETGPAGLVVTITAERPETLDLLRRYAEQFLADLRQSGFSGASLQFGQGHSGQGQFGQGQFAEGQNGPPQTNSRTGSEYAAHATQLETPLHLARQNHAGGLNLRL